MIQGRKILVVVPARGGSKGIPLKNLRKTGGKSLVAHVADVIGKIPAIDRSVVSTDHDGIAAECEAAGLSAPFRRPEAISGDRISDWDVLLHALTEVETLDNTQYDIIVMLQPTSPMRKPEHVLDCIEMLVDGNWDSVWTVSETDSKAHPLKQLTVHEGKMDYYDPDGGKIIARQQLTPVYHRNGLAYAITRECLVNQKTIKGTKTGALIVDDPMANIDTEFDLLFADFLMSQGTKHND